VPNFNDAAGLTVIDRERAPYIHEIASLKTHDSNILTLGFRRMAGCLASGSTDKTVQVAWLPRLKATTRWIHSTAGCARWPSRRLGIICSPGCGMARSLWGLQMVTTGDDRGAGQPDAGDGFCAPPPDLIAVAAGSF